MYNAKNKYIDKSVNYDKADFRDLDFFLLYYGKCSKGLFRGYNGHIKKRECFWHDSCMR